MKYWFIFYKGSILLRAMADGTYTIPSGESFPLGCGMAQGDTAIDVQPMADGTCVKACEMGSEPCGTGYELCGLRQSYYKLTPALYQEAGKCAELLYWHRNTRYCGVCGAPMAMDTLISKRCTRCGKTSWPQLNTAIIVLITRGSEMLLVHARNFKTDFYGCVAGFVETGESLEEAVAREVREETALSIRNLRYFKSQPWPYPCGLMVGFFAEYESGTLRLQDSELSRGGWFDSQHLPTIPEKLSLARMLIDKWLDDNKAMCGGNGGGTQAGNITNK